MKVFSFWKTPKDGNVPPYVLMGLASMKMTFGDDFLLLTERNLHKHVDVKLNRDIEWAITRQYLDTKNPQHPKTMQEYKQFVWEKKQNVLEHKKPKTKAEQRAYWENLDKKRKKQNG